MLPPWIHALEEQEPSQQEGEESVCVYIVLVCVYSSVLVLWSHTLEPLVTTYTTLPQSGTMQVSIVVYNIPLFFTHKTFDVAGIIL